MIRSILTTGVLLGLVSSLVGSPRDLAAQAGGEYRLAGDEVAIYTLAGRVRVEGGSGAEVVVEVTPGGRDSGELRVETGPISGRETLRIVFPSDRITYPEMGGGSRTEMRVRSDGTFGDGGRFGRGDRVRISGRGGGLEAHADLRIAVPEGREISVYLGVGEITAENVDGRVRLDTGAGEVIASGIRGSLSVDTGSGSVRVAGMDGELSVDTGSGSVDVTDVTGPRVDVDTGSGSVDGRAIRASSVRVDTGSGSVTLEALAASDIEVDTGSGSVDLDLLEDVDHLEVDTGSGGVTLRVPPELGAELEIETGSGGIETDVAVQIRSVERNELRGSIGDGRGRIQIDTGSGGVRIRGG